MNSDFEDSRRTSLWITTINALPIEWSTEIEINLALWLPYKNLLALFNSFGFLIGFYPSSPFHQNKIELVSLIPVLYKTPRPNRLRNDVSPLALSL